MKIIIKISAEEVREVLADYANRNQVLGIEIKPDDIVVEDDGEVEVIVSNMSGAGLAKG